MFTSWLEEGVDDASGAVAGGEGSAEERDIGDGGDGGSLLESYRGMPKREGY